MPEGATSLDALSIEQQRLLLAQLLEKQAAARQRTFPASAAQEGLWFLHQLEPASPAYNIPMALRLAGRLDREVLEGSLQEIVRRHWTLRTSFAAADGGVVQRVAPFSPFPVPLEDLARLSPAERERELARRMGEEARRPFDLTRAPLFRAGLLRLAPREHVFYLVVHHTVFDGWSMGVLIREFAALYRARAEGQRAFLPELPLQYVDFAEWQRERLKQGDFAEQLAYWRGQLSGRAAPLELPTDKPRPARWSFRGEAASLALPGDLSAALADLSRQAGASLFITLLSGVFALLSRYTGQSDLAIGSPIANRNRSEVEGLIGFFANTLVFRLQAKGGEGFAALLAEVRQVAFAAYAHQDLPFERLVQELRPERDLSRSPLFQVMFTLQNAPLPPIELPGVSLTVLDLDRTTARFDLLFELWETAAGLAGLLEYSTDLFAPPTAARLGRVFQNLLAGAVADPGRPLTELPLLDPGERSQLLAEWNDTARRYPQGLCLHQLFEAQVERSPAAEAVRCAGQSLTYRDLDLASNRLARWLRQNGVGPEAVVGVLLDRSLEMVVALFAVLKAGGAYLPLDPSYPKERLAFFVEDARPALVLTASGLADLAPAASRTVLLDALDGGWQDSAVAASGERLAPAADPDGLAYVIYTSGSTGRPKGAMNAHRGIVNRILWMQEAYGLGLADRVLQKTPASFDVSVWEFFWPLATGACLVMARPEGHRDPAYLIAAIVEEGITTLHFVPSMLRAFLEAEGVERCTSIRRVMASGEELPAEVAARFFARLSGAELHNLYGPTEAAVDVTAWACRQGDDARVPIGRPIANLRIHLLDPHGHPALLGVPGELRIGGVGVGRGYLGRPELTAERFVPDPWSPEPGGRLYRTGDLARYRLDGAIDFLGRLDHQVKLRGFRIELGEIEHALRSLPGVRDAVVTVRDTVRGKGAEQRLVAYVMADDGTAAVARWREALRERLPDYMVPAAWVALPELPLLANGKVDRKALPEPSGTTAGGVLVAPRTYLEEIVAGIWAGLLGAEQLGVHENVFDLGAHSLMATQVVSRVNRELGVDVPLRRVFELPTVALFAAEIEERYKAAERPVPPIRPVARDGLLPLSFSQQRIWFFERLEPESAVFNIPTALALAGELSIPALAASLGEVVRRHEVLRTRFLDVGGEAAQVIDPFRPLAAPLVDLTALASAARQREGERLAREEAIRPFDLERQSLLRAVLLRTAKTEHTALLTMHHIAADGWSLRILTEEVSAAYAAFATGRPSPLPELPLQFVDYAAWQREWLQGDVLAGELAFWREQLAGAPAALDLPLDHPRPPVQRYRGRRSSLTLSRERSAALTRLSREVGGTLFMALVTATNALLARYAQRDDLVTGTLIANRNRREVEGLIGFFVNALALRTRMTEELTFRAALERVRETTLEVYAHQDLPFEKLVEELKPERHLGLTPLFQVLLVLQNTPPAALELPGLRLAAREVERGTVNYDLYFTFLEDAGGVGGIAVQLDYDTDLFDEPTIRRLLAHLEAMVEAMAGGAERRPREVDLLYAAERQHVLIEWNDAARQGSPPPALLERLADQARRRPAAPAVACGAERLTYGELHARVERAARVLAGYGIGRGDLAALLLDRGIDFLTAVLALWRCGGAYLPLDPAYPERRIGQILAASAAPFVLVSEDFAERLDIALGALGALAPGSRPRVLRSTALRGEEPRAARLPQGATPGDLAYVIYTSGSTGEPKGVMIEQGGMENHLAAKIAALGLSERDVVAQNASQCFDISVWQLCAALAVGGAVEIVPDEIAHDPARLLSAVERGGITVLEVVPAVLRAMLDEIEGRPGARPALARLRWVVPTGEALAAELCDRWLAHYPAIPLLNAYGPTECSDDVSHLPIRAPGAAGERLAPLGRPVSNTALYVLDPRLAPTPMGLSGELSVGGAGVGRGYLFDPARTAQSFVPDGLSGACGARLYRTGDRARFLPDGRIEFLGRLDHQVKVRGFRIETGEIEALLGRRSEVGQAVVVARRDEGSVRLVAYVTPALDVRDGLDGGPAAEVGERERGELLRAYLADLLPDYMIPACFVFLDRLPLTPNGKIDHQALPAPEVSRAAARVAPPRSRTEKALAEIWRAVLGAPGGREIGLEDSFFALGGHSLLATRVLSALRATLGVDLPLRDLFEAPNLAALAARVDAALGGGFDPSTVPILPAPPEEAELPSFAQERLWFLDQLDPGSPAYNLQSAVLAVGAASPRVFLRVLREIVRRHAALRTTFRAAAGRPRQIVHPELALELPQVDLRALPEAAAQAETIRWATLDARRPFDLERGPLLRAALLERPGSEHVLLLNLHHIVSDGWSMGVFLAEVAALYPAFAQGLPSPLAELPLQYPDYAYWQRRLLQGELLERQLAYWKKQLADPPDPLDLQGPGARPAVFHSAHGGTRRFHLPPALAERLRTLSRQRETTLFMTLLAGFAALLRRYSGQTDLTIGVPVAGRSRSELEGLIGFFVNTLVVRLTERGPASGEALLAGARRAALDAFTHQDLPFEKLVAELNPDRDLLRSPLFQVMFALQNAPAGRIELPGLSLHRLDIETGTTRFELFLEMMEAGEELEGALHFSCDLFDAPFIARFVGHFAALLHALVADPAGEVAGWPLLAPAEQAQVVREWNDSAREFPLSVAFPELFAARVAEQPERVAAVEEGSYLSYAELDARANALARQLTGRGLHVEGIEGVVALLAERGLDFLAAVLGVFKAGGAYLPLDPHHPANRIRQVLGESRSPLALAAGALEPLLRAASAGAPEELPILTLEPLLAGRETADRETAGLPARGSAEHLAYVIFTSGSTGVPKGAMVVHRGMINHLYAKIVELGLTAGDVVAQTASQCFDISVWQFLAPLLVGGRVEIYPDRVAHDPAVLLDRLAADGVTVVETVPSLLRLMLEEVRRRAGAAPDLAGLRWLVPTGEALPPELCREWSRSYPGIAVLNAYGPTECSDDVSHFRVPAALEADARSIPIGRPVGNTQLYVLDVALFPVPPGVRGELCVGGDGVGRGYLRDPARTAAVFVPDPSTEQSGARLYRTGDLARFRSDGELEFLGRIDHQVKVRGFRLELGEIEALLGEHPALSAAVVLARPEASGTHRLVAYVVARTSPAPAPPELREHLQSRLPEYAIPSAWVALDSLPLSASGKVDRRALPDPGAETLAQGQSQGQPYVAPRSEVEEAVAAVFAEVIGVERVGAFDNFFDLGGHSLLATQATWKLRESFGVELALRALFEAPTVAELAGVIEERIIEQIEGLSDDEVDALLEPTDEDMALPEDEEDERVASG
jgi:amino acid adenylation domain-containing protein